MSCCRKSAYEDRGLLFGSSWFEEEYPRPPKEETVSHIECEHRYEQLRQKYVEALRKMYSLENPEGCKEEK